MMSENIKTDTNKYDFILDSLGFENEPLEQRAFIFCKILKELNITFKKYYTSPKHKYLRSKPYKEHNDFSNMGMVVVADCDKNYAQYTIYLYKRKMEEISTLNKIFSL